MNKERPIIFSAPMASYKGRIASLEEAIGEAPALRMAAE